MAHALDLATAHPMVTPRVVAVTADAARDVAAVARGDRDAFAGVYAAYGRMVRAILLGRVPRADVDDLLQDVFLAAYTHIGELRDPSAFGSWIGAIARNRAVDFLRRRRPQVELPEELPGCDAIPAESLAALDAIRRLPEAYRDTLMLRLVERMSGNEIAERTGLTPASVRVNLHRGMKLLRERLT